MQTGSLGLYSSPTARPQGIPLCLPTTVARSVAQLAALQFFVAAQPQLPPSLLRTEDRTVAQVGQFSSQINPLAAHRGSSFSGTAAWTSAPTLPPVGRSA